MKNECVERAFNCANAASRRFHSLAKGSRSDPTVPDGVGVDVEVCVEVCVMSAPTTVSR